MYCMYIALHFPSGSGKSMHTPFPALWTHVQYRPTNFSGYHNVTRHQISNIPVPIKLEDGVAAG